MKAKSLMTAVLLSSLFLVSREGFSESIKADRIVHYPNGVPFQDIVLTASDRDHGWAWGTLLHHGHRGKPSELPDLDLETTFTSEATSIPTPIPLTLTAISGGSALSTTVASEDIAEVPEPMPILLLAIGLFLIATWQFLRLRKSTLRN